MHSAHSGRYYGPTRSSGRLIRGFFYAPQYIVLLCDVRVFALGLVYLSYLTKSGQPLGGIEQICGTERFLMFAAGTALITFGSESMPKRYFQTVSHRAIV